MLIKIKAFYLHEHLSPFHYRHMKVDFLQGDSDTGGIRYQVPDITLVGGSFFLPKTQLVHGTNWWVYCPFSRKTGSTWY